LQGGSFAVLASKVRTLTQRSASPAKEIKGLIEASEVMRQGIELATIVSEFKIVGGKFFLYLLICLPKFRA
jgi:methyl-accepting chemotaxis protein